jgi:hypothetical protein
MISSGRTNHSFVFIAWKAIHVWDLDQPRTLALRDLPGMDFGPEAAGRVLIAISH